MQNTLRQGQIVMHSGIIAELALGLLREPAETLAMLDLLPRVYVAQLSEVRLMIEARPLGRLGIGLNRHTVDRIHLSQSAPHFCGQETSHSAESPVLLEFGLL